MRKNNMVTVSSLLGTNVKNHHFEHLGKLKELVIDLATGQIIYAVLACSKFMKIGNKLMAIPIDCIHSSEDGCLIIRLDKSQLLHTRGFDKKNWPNIKITGEQHEHHNQRNER